MDLGWGSVFVGCGEAFYEDGEEHMKGATQTREIMAIAQYFSDTPIKPYEVMRGTFFRALMEIDDILSQFDRSIGRFPRASVREAVTRREDVTPVLRGAGPRNAPQSARTALQA